MLKTKKPSVILITEGFLNMNFMGFYRYKTSFTVAITLSAFGR